MDSTDGTDSLTATSLATPEERLKIWQSVKGIWQDRVPDPVEELEKTRAEWDRNTPGAH